MAKKVNIQRFIVLNHKLFKTEKDAEAFTVQLDLSERLSQFLTARELTDQFNDMERNGQCPDPKGLIQDLEGLIKILQKIDPVALTKLPIGELHRRSFSTKKQKFADDEDHGEESEEY